MFRIIQFFLVVGVSLVTFNTSAISVSISVDKNISQHSKAPGRIFVIFSKNENAEPRFGTGWPSSDAAPFYAQDISSINEGQSLQLSNKVVGFPIPSLKDLPLGEWYVQALYDVDTEYSSFNAPGNLISEPVKINIENSTQNFSLKLVRQLPPEKLPEETEYLKYIKIKSKKLSTFWGRDVFLRAAVLLPSTYSKTNTQFPTYYNVGGYGSRYTRVSGRAYMGNPAFKKMWLNPESPQIAMVFLDGEGPLGDSYQINSATNGPYGDATTEELIPAIEKRFALNTDVKSRFVSGCSTGGWASLALQTFYPDFFNGAWSFSTDSVDFRQFQLINIYDDKNAFRNKYDNLRPSMRSNKGDILFTIQREVAMENVLGRGDQFVTSGGQWGGWNAVYGKPDKQGLPQAIFDPKTGKIDKNQLAHWKQYDLRDYVEKNWAKLGPSIQGKIYIWMGDMDNFYLNNAMYLFNDMLSQQVEPSADAEVHFQSRKGHCNMDITQKMVMQMMLDKYTASK